MKKVKFFGLAGIILLASGAGFSSCSSDSADPTGGTGVAGQVVKAQFYLNIPYAGNEKGGNARVSTRMSANNTQKNNNFLGLADMEMFAFSETPSSGVTSTRTIRIGDNTGTSENDDKRILYSDIAIPVGTTNMILYTRASKKSNTSTGTKNEFQVGSLTNPYTNFTDEAKPTLSELKFNLETIHSTNDFTATQGSAILNKLNVIAQTKATVSGATIEWSKIGEASTGTQEEREILKKLYTNFVSLTAGSEKSVIRAIEDLKAAVETQQLADFSELTQAIKDNCTTTELNTEFPRNLNLPDGAAVLTFNSESKTFTYKEITAGVPTGSGNLVDYKTITYPSELAYFVSSPVGTSSTKDKLADLPDYNAWLGNTADWNEYGDVVKGNTTLVVLKEPVQYGVACLESKIKCATASLDDNAKQIIKSTANNTLTVPEAGITVTGILVGGQPQGVEWNFEPASDAKFDHTIYDQDMNNGIAAKTSATNPNYTLVLDNKNSSTTNAAQSKVYVTVELENNMGDFYGKEGLIPKGSRFYLVGELDPTNKTTTVDHVFVKDHTTVANFTITSLKNAYNHIPDMRTSKINVGLAVDLSWKSGIEFNVDL